MIRPAVSLILAIAPLFIGPDIPWNKSKSGSGVVVFTRAVPGSPIKEIKADLELACSLNTAVACLSDISLYPQWIYQMTEARIISKVSPTDFTVYQKISTPWPLDDRDVCGHYTIKQNPVSKDIVMETHAVPNVLPAVKGIVRVRKNHTVWVLRPLAKNKLKGEYFISLDPAGEVPAWIINLFITEGPYSSLTKLKQRVLLPKYANAHFDWVIEKYP